jgi:hypothetical protein
MKMLSKTIIGLWIGRIQIDHQPGKNVAQALKVVMYPALTPLRRASCMYLTIKIKPFPKRPHAVRLILSRQA